MRPILSRRCVWSCPWLAVDAKEVQLAPPRGRETFYSVRTTDYAAVLAVTSDGRVPLVRQFRPAVEENVLELPSGLLEPGEDPEVGIRRELLEETGCEAGSLVSLGRLFLDSGRMQTRQWAFFAPGVRVVATEPTGEEELEIVFVERRELWDLVRRGDFSVAGHLSLLAIAQARGLLEL